MICLDNTDVIEGGASVDAKVDYTIYGLVGTTFTQLAAGVMNTTLTSVLYTAGAAISVVSIILVNTHTSAVSVTLSLDPANGGNPRYLIPKTISLGASYSLHTDGTRITVMDASGNIQTMPGLHASRHLAGAADPITTMVTSTNVITDHTLIRGDGGVRGTQETSAICTDAGELYNPSQPAFNTYVSTQQSNVTGDNTIYDITGAFWTEVFDQGNDLSNGTFTAPITGRYQLSGIAYVSGVTGSMALGNFRLTTSNRNYLNAFHPGNTAYNATSFGWPWSFLVDMDANDTAYLTLTVGNDTKSIDILVTYTFFTGVLIC